MAYSQDLRGSALRHYRSGNELYQLVSAGSQPGCKAVAGYLYGLAGELALKHLMLAVGIKPNGGRNDDPFFVHFPTLRQMLEEQLSGRSDTRIRRFIEDKSLFQFWDTKMRYAPTADIKEQWVEKWKQNAKDIIEEMEL